MSKKGLITIFFFVLILLFPAKAHAADLEIYCYENQKPVIVSNSSPLFTISGFTPGNKEKRSVFMKNYDPVNSCRIYIDAVGTENNLTDILQMNIPNLYSSSLSRFIENGNLLLVDLNPGEDKTHDLEIIFPSSYENDYQEEQASFNLIITSEWGGDESQDSNVLGEQTENIHNEIEENGDVLGLGIDNTCINSPYWWIILLVQSVISFLILFVDKRKLKYLYVKLGSSIIIAIIAFFLINYFGCGCNPIFICKFHWALNIVIALIPISRYLLKK